MKHRIIPQMFDVRPVNETGDLDWQKIQNIGKSEQILEQRISEEKKQLDLEKEKQRLLKIEKQEIFFQQQERARREKQAQIKFAAEQRARIIMQQQLQQQEYQRKLVEEKERLELERQKQAFLFEQEKLKREQERARVLEEEKRQAAILVEKKRLQAERLERMRKEALWRKEEMQKNVEENHRRQKQEQQAKVLAEKKQRQAEYTQWLQNELAQQQKAEKMEAILEAKNSKTKKQKIAKNKFNNSKEHFSWRELFCPPKLAFKFDINKSLMPFVLAAVLVLLGVGGVTYASKGISLKDKLLGASGSGLENLNLAVSDIKNQNFEQSEEKFAKAYASFASGSQELDGMGSVLIETSRFVPFASKISSGKNALEAGKHFSAAGKALNEVAKITSQIKNSNGSTNQTEVSLLDILNSAQKNITEARVELDAAQGNLDQINVDDLPEDKRDKFVLIKQQLPDLRNAMDFFLNNSHILTDLLGGNGPRKYLFLFQNNSEMRATGGFVGSYGLLDIANGHVKKFFIDGIFNPDGQLREKIVPPLPIQKISAAWSMHDSNWFPNFPTSAQKAISFYEKTGGPTADGVITLTPTVMQELLKITGPIEMPEYDVTLDSQNFVEMTQQEVEVEYDKQENKPKKILSDLAPLLLEKLLNSKDLNSITKTANVLLKGLKEKHILFYSENAELQKMISEQGWSGETLAASKDYLSVVNSNINGYKTDAVVKENISHKAEIQSDGSIIDTVSITRKHNGGDTQYEWFNKVNADYMRVYVPEGAKLLEVSGQTREQDSARLDYDALNFKRDAEVQNQESSIEIDENSGTRVYSENGKTVFANWTYVSSGETMTITYKYLLPFALFRVAVGDGEQVDSYSLVVQKQSGSVGSEFESEILYPKEYQNKWSFPENANIENQSIKNSTKLNVDRFEGVLFVKN